MPEKNDESDMANITKNELKLILEHQGMKICPREITKAKYRAEVEEYRLFSPKISRSLTVLLCLVLAIMLIIDLPTGVFAIFATPVVLHIFTNISFWISRLCTPVKFVKDIYLELEYLALSLVMSVVIGVSYSLLPWGLLKFNFSNKTVAVIVLLLTPLFIRLFCISTKKYLMSQHRKWMFLNFWDKELAPYTLIYILCILSRVIFVSLDSELNFSWPSEVNNLDIIFGNIIINTCFTFWIIISNDKKMYDRYSDHFQDIIQYMPKG